MLFIEILFLQSLLEFCEANSVAWVNTVGNVIKGLMFFKKGNRTLLRKTWFAEKWNKTMHHALMRVHCGNSSNDFCLYSLLFTLRKVNSKVNFQDSVQCLVCKRCINTRVDCFLNLSTLFWYNFIVTLFVLYYINYIVSSVLGKDNFNSGLYGKNKFILVLKTLEIWYQWSQAGFSKYTRFDAYLIAWKWLSCDESHHMTMWLSVSYLEETTSPTKCINSFRVVSS